MARLGAVTGLFVVQALLRGELVIQAPAFVALDPETEFRASVSDDFLWRPAEGCAEVVFVLDEHAVADTRHADGVGAGLEQGGEFLLRGGQALFALYPFADVDEDASHAQGLALF